MKMAKQLRGHSKTFSTLLLAVLVLVTTLVSANVVLGQDSAPPVITKSIPGTPQFASGSNTYITSATTLRVNVTDADTGVQSCSITVTDSSNAAVLAPSCASGDNDFTLPSSLPDGVYTISATATDAAGNTSSDPMTVILDNTGPNLSKTVGTPQHISGGATYVKSTTAISVSADDGTGSGVASCTLSGSAQVTGSYTPGSSFFLTAQDGSKTYTVNCQDNLGNQASPLTETDTVDDTAPTITITSPVGTYTLNQPNVVASYSCDDGAGSGVAICAGDLSNDAIIDTSSAALGSHTFTVKATDNLGNAASSSADYSVRYNQTSGRKILAPLQQVSDPAQLTKTYNLGRTLPVKFQLSDEKGAFIGTAKATLTLYDAKGAQVSVKNSGNSNGGTTAFRYDPVAQQYIYNLSTKNLSQGIYKIVIKLGDGTEISTYFRLTK